MAITLNLELWLELLSKRDIFFIVVAELLAHKPGDVNAMFDLTGETRLKMKQTPKKA